MSEAEIHKAIAAWLILALPDGSVFHHSPNEGNHKVQYRVLQKKLGVRAGWPDLELFVHPDAWKKSTYADWCPIFLEIKKPKGRVSPNQKEVIADLVVTGCLCFIVHSIDEVREALEELIELKDG